ncbi:hypothetical protein ACQPYA_12525 [Micromonospora sp. CA-263727]|uniref:hypothetical protein n=1 Tax=Micromonospora sp. CA-263727 TaxID=3239967 RepID=UPI003D938928
MHSLLSGGIAYIAKSVDPGGWDPTTLWLPLLSLAVEGWMQSPKHNRGLLARSFLLV